MEAIETIYNGYRFRSRLEARWAVFFDTLNIQYQYEKEGFEKEIGEGKIVRYLPDFYLPLTETWVEVKSSPVELSKEAIKLGSILDYGSPLPGIEGSGDNLVTNFGKKNGLLILYDIPHVSWGFVAHPFITHHKGLEARLAIFINDGLHIISPEQRYILHFFVKDIGHDGWFDGYAYDEKDWLLKEYVIPSPRAIWPVVEAYQKARQARFEHGEYGNGRSSSICR